ncbi:hypothetical protein [Dyella humicola]|uniref:hypothetical protein n=1 Tax=Dyella humicola TaxID=2992126 RepID=UPI002255CAF9|nr:hypothetical protein [Dyella humicola]
MTTNDYFKAEWLALDPDVLERLIPVRHGHVRIEDIEAASRTTAPNLEQAWAVCAYGITCSGDGIPLRDWRRFLGTLRWMREQAQR